MHEKALIILEALLRDQTKTHEELVSYICETLPSLLDFKTLTKKEAIDIAFEYERIYGGKTFVPGITISNGKIKDTWFSAKKKILDKSNGHHFQRRYELFLSLRHFGSKTIKSIVGEMERVLSFCANPDENANERRRGLVIGDVQSGKTSNYLALASIACDYGYKVIVILAGMTDSLRIQTQERVDEGFVGAVSSSIGNDTVNYLGVGRLSEPQAYYASPLTTDKKDFETISASSSDFNKPIVLVVKKNKHVLTMVRKWLKPGQYGVSSQNVLIIDDECDNASVNTKKDENPSTINGLIRDIYNNFPCSTYIGFTATPFANIFINPDKQAGFDDLFPNDFIHRLHASPESYFGVEKVFEPYDGSARHLVVLDEDEPLFLPVKHKKTTDYPGLTNSLKNAICNFLICNCIRTSRGNSTSHRSMMINISPYNDIQESIHDAVQEYVDTLRNTISQYDKFSIERFVKNREMKRIFDIYNTDDFYRKPNSPEGACLADEVPFTKIKDLLFDEISRFEVAIVNNKYKGDQRFNYKERTHTGARVIAIGGYVLSRGLTLEGLMTSYYSRNCAAYDTLLQMCRWFGYRPNYEDLCRVYMSQISVDSFGAVVDAVRNLDEQLEIMNVQGKTPRDFGLMIQESPETLETQLLITARNKMRNTVVVERGLNYSGVAIDTSKIYKSKEANVKNTNEFRNFCSAIKQDGVYLEKTWNNRWMYKNVKPNRVADFICSLALPIENRKFNKDSLAEFIRSNQYYDLWDVVIATGDRLNDFFEIENGKSVPGVLRKFESRDEEDYLRISSKNNRILEPGIFNAGLDENQIKEAELNMKNRLARSHNVGKTEHLIASDYLEVHNRNPLMVVLPICLNVVNEESAQKQIKKRNIKDAFEGNCLLGFGIGFPGRKDERRIMTFRMNKIKAREYYSVYDDEEVFDD